MENKPQKINSCDWSFRRHDKVTLKGLDLKTIKKKLWKFGGILFGVMKPNWNFLGKWINGISGGCGEQDEFNQISEILFKVLCL